MLILIGIVICAVVILGFGFAPAETRTVIEGVVKGTYRTGKFVVEHGVNLAKITAKGTDILINKMDEKMNNIQSEDSKKSETNELLSYANNAVTSRVADPDFDDSVIDEYRKIDTEKDIEIDESTDNFRVIEGGKKDTGVSQDKNKYTNVNAYNPSNKVAIKETFPVVEPKEVNKGIDEKPLDINKGVIEHQHPVTEPTLNKMDSKKSNNNINLLLDIEKAETNIKISKDYWQGLVNKPNKNKEDWSEEFKARIQYENDKKELEKVRNNYTESVSVSSDVISDKSPDIPNMGKKEKNTEIDKIWHSNNF